MSRLEGKRAIVTGAARGIGEAIARLFAEQGARVAVADINPAGAENVAAAIRDAGGEAMTVAVDVSSEQSAAAMAEVVASELGAIDILQNNAANIEFGPVHELAEDSWHRVMAANLTGVYLASKAVIPHMLDGDGGAIVNTCSINALHGQPGFAAYNASKGGVLALTRQMALEYGPRIRVNCISPGVTNTPAVRSAIAAAEDPDGFERMLVNSNHIARRLADPREIAYAALFLASDEASFCFGTDLMVGGGQAVPP